jgi:hypothetical protein
LKNNPDIAETIGTQIRESYGLVPKPQDDQSATVARVDSKKNAGGKG